MVNWRGVTLDQRTANMMDEVAAAVGMDIYIKPWQGSYSSSVGASAGTHSGCGAIDIAARGYSDSQTAVMVTAMRKVGFAAWRRGPADGMDPHIHGIAVQPGGKSDRGCLSAAAHDQVVDYYEARNGLANNGPDKDPRQYVGATWEQYQAAAMPKEMEHGAMILIKRKSNGRVYLLGLNGPAYISNGNDLSAIRNALKDPANSIAEIGDGTYGYLLAHAPSGAVPKD